MSSDKSEGIRLPFIEKADLDSGLVDHAMDLLKTDPRMFELNKSGQDHAPGAAEIFACSAIIPSKEEHTNQIFKCAAIIPSDRSNPEDHIFACSAVITNGGKDVTAANPYLENCRKPGPWPSSPDVDFHTEKKMGGDIKTL